MLSKPWISPPKEPPQGTSQSSTSPRFPYSSSSRPENTARAAQIPPTTCLDSRKSNSSLDSSPTTQQCQLKSSLLRNIFSVSCSRRRIMEPKASQSVTKKPATPKGVQWHPCVEKWYTFDAMAPLARSPFQASRKRTGGTRSAEMRSWPPSEPWSV